MIGQIYTELNDNKNAIEFYEIADKIYPENYYNLHPLLALYFKTDNPKKQEETEQIHFIISLPINPQFTTTWEISFMKTIK